MNIKEIAYCHYMPEKRCRRRANTVEGYESALRCHVIPRFGHVAIEDLDHDEIQAWVDGFCLPGAAEKAFKTLRQVVRWAIRHFQLRIWDPTQGIELPRKPAYRPQTLEPEQVADTLRGFWGHELEPTVILASTLGLRPGEAYALRWDRIDMRSGAVRICETLQEVRGLTYLYPPKTAKGDRVGYLPKFALERLREIWRAHGRPKGRILATTPSRAAKRIKAHCKAQGLPYVPMYNRRHTWATIAVEAGASLEAVAMMLGHSNVMTAYEHYIVPRKSVFKDVQALFQRAVIRA